MISIAIDGPAASGKGTLAKAIAKHLDLKHLDTGLLYRAVAYKWLNSKEQTEQEATDIAKKLTLEDTQQKGLRTEEIGEAASVVSAFEGVRGALVEVQRSMAKDGAVLDGRDIGTIILPDADIKLYITADIEVRARRRTKQLQEAGKVAIYDQILQDLTQRDARDSNRDIAPLRPAKDAVIIDSSELPFNKVLEKSLTIIKAATAI